MPGRRISHPRLDMASPELQLLKSRTRVLPKGNIRVVIPTMEPKRFMKNLIALSFVLLLTASAQASHETRRGPDLAYSCDTVR
jgi:hypothetical protein